MDSEKQDELILKVYDLNGRMAYQSNKLQITKGKNNLFIENISLQHGIHFCQLLTTDGRTYTNKIINL